MNKQGGNQGPTYALTIVCILYDRFQQRILTSRSQRALQTGHLLIWEASP